jgi:hypothetical protein
LTLSDRRVVGAADNDNDGTYEAAVAAASVASVGVVDSCANGS